MSTNKLEYALELLAQHTRDNEREAKKIVERLQAGDYDVSTEQLRVDQRVLRSIARYLKVVQEGTSTIERATLIANDYAVRAAKYARTGAEEAEVMGRVADFFNGL